MYVGGYTVNDLVGLYNYGGDLFYIPGTEEYSTLDADIMAEIINSNAPSWIISKAMWQNTATADY